MSAKLLHGLLLGALIACVSFFLELLARLQAFPYHRDFDAFRLWLPRYAAVGALIGLLAAFLLPWISRKADRNRQPGLHLAAAISGLIALLVMAPRGLPVDSWIPLLVIELKAGLIACLVYAVFYAFARSKFAWTLAGFTTPWFSLVALAVALLLSTLTDYMALRPSPGSSVAGPIQEGENDSSIEYPNVLLVVLDGVGAKHLGCYGYHRSTSPELDRLATESVLFENAFAAAAWTLPSHASLFTGLQQTSHRVGWEHPRLADGSRPGQTLPSQDAWTLAEELGARGFQTCGVSDSKWLGSHNGLTQGFQHYFDFQLKQVHQRLFLSRLFRDSSLFEAEETSESSGQRVVETALQWLKQPRMRKEDQPFFLFVNLNEAEAPYTLPKSFSDLDRFIPPGLDLEQLSPAYLATADTRRAFNLGLRDLEPEESEIQTGLYDAAILYQDRLLGQLVEGLREIDVLENTIVVFVADHGEEFNQQSRFGHQCSLSDEILHIPFMIRYPSLLPAGRRVPNLVSQVDVFPTVLSLLETSSGKKTQATAKIRGLEGFDLSQIAAGDGKAPRDWILAQYQNPARFLFQNSTQLLDFSSAWQARSITTLRSAESKYFRFGDGTQAFLDLARDPDEDAAESATIPPEHRAQAAQYSRSLQQLENWLKTRRTILLSQQENSGAWPLANSKPVSQQELFGIPAKLFKSTED